MHATESYRISTYCCVAEVREIINADHAQITVPVVAETRRLTCGYVVADGPGAGPGGLCRRERTVTAALRKLIWPPALSWSGQVKFWPFCRALTAFSISLHRCYKFQKGSDPRSHL